MRPKRFQATHTPKFSRRGGVLACVLEWTQLTELRLNCCGVDQACFDLICGGLPCLRVLELAWSEASDLRRLAELPALCYLNLDYCANLKMPEPNESVTPMPRITTLRLAGSVDMRPMSNLQMIPNLFPNVGTLTLKGVHNMPWLQHCAYLEKLELHQYRLDGKLDALLQQLPASLRRLGMHWERDGDMRFVQVVSKSRKPHIKFEALGDGDVV
jgi:hypothetical protein